MARTVTIPNAIDTSIARSCISTGGFPPGGENTSANGRPPMVVLIIAPVVEVVGSIMAWAVEVLV